MKWLNLDSLESVKPDPVLFSGFTDQLRRDFSTEVEAFVSSILLEDRSVVDRINRSGAGLVFVGLGCPKQDLFAYGHRHTIKAVQVCVGAAFDFHATAIVDGSRRIAVGTEVSFVVAPGHRGRYEARGLTRVDSTPDD